MDITYGRHYSLVGATSFLAKIDGCGSKTRPYVLSDVSAFLELEC